MTDSPYDPITSLRIPVDLKAAVKRRAEAANRSFTQEVVWVLRQHVENTPEPKPRSRVTR